MLDTIAVSRAGLNREPFSWCEIEGLFHPADADRLASTYPRDHFRTIEAYGGEKDYRYDVRALVSMPDGSTVWPDDLSPEWSLLARDLAGDAYRDALSHATGMDLTDHPREVNVYHYGPGAMLGPHQDLPEKVVVHVLYFNRSWEESAGGCLAILRSKDPDDVAAVVLPVLGSSALFVRSPDSWHEVRPVAPHVTESRRSVVVTFYEPGSVSPMWTDDSYELHEVAGDGACGPVAGQA